MNDDTSEYRFYAFISYSRKDDGVARWLQKRLETYRLPSVLQRQHIDIPKRLHIFRDKTDIGVGGTVEHSLSKELSASKKLIVLCSPDAAKSDYVEYEVASFLKLGRSTDDILPFVVRGTIDSSSDDNCYTSLLMNLNINAADAVHEGRHNAFVRLLASLLEINYNDLMRREHVRMVRRYLICIFMFIFACIGFSIITWYLMPHTKCYADYVVRWGVPQGIRRLKQSELRFFPSHYLITTKCWRPIKLVHVYINRKEAGESFLDEHQDRPAMAEYHYKHSFFPTQDIVRWDLNTVIWTHGYGAEKDFKICRLKLTYVYYSRTGAVIDFCYDTPDALYKGLSNDVLSYGTMYFPEEEVFVEGPGNNGLAMSNPELLFLDGTGTICRQEIQYYDENAQETGTTLAGFEKKILFYNWNGHRVSDRNGIYGYTRDYDSVGHVVKETYLYDMYVSSLPLLAHKDFTYDDNGRLSSVAFYARTEIIDGKTGLVRDKNRNVALIKMDWAVDGKGNPVHTICFYDEHNNPAGDSLCNDAIQVVYTYKEIAGTSVLEKESIFEDFTLTSTMIYDDSGFLKEFYQRNGHAITTYRFRYDENSKSSTCTVYDAEENMKQKMFRTCMILHDETFESILYEHPDGSSYTVTAYYDVYGRLADYSAHYGDDVYSMKITYYGNNKSIRHFHNGITYMPPEYGYSHADFSYTADGMLYYVEFRDADGEPVDSLSAGFSKYIALYSPNALLLKADYIDKTGRPTCFKHTGVISFVAKNDATDSFLLTGQYILEEKNEALDDAIILFDYEVPSEHDVVVTFYDKKRIPRYRKYYHDAVLQYQDLLSEDGMAVFAQYDMREAMTSIANDMKAYLSEEEEVIKK